VEDTHQRITPRPRPQPCHRDGKWQARILSDPCAGPSNLFYRHSPLQRFRSYNAFLPYTQESTQPGALRSFCWRRRLFPSVGFIALTNICHLFCWLRTFVSCYSLSSPTSYVSFDNISALSLSLLEALFTFYDRYNTHCSNGLHKRQYT
jgi:hypothetical protein